MYPVLLTYSGVLYSYIENKYNLPTDNVEYTQHVLTKAQKARLQKSLEIQLHQSWLYVVCIL